MKFNIHIVIERERKMIPLILIVVGIPLCCRLSRDLGNILAILIVSISLPWIYIDFQETNDKITKTNQLESAINLSLPVLKEEVPSLPENPTLEEALIQVMPVMEAYSKICSNWNNHRRNISDLKSMNLLLRPAGLLLKGRISELKDYVPEDDDIVVEGNKVTVLGGPPVGISFELNKI